MPKSCAQSSISSGNSCAHTYGFDNSNLFLTLYTGFPEQFRDFNTTPITVTFQQGNTEVMTVNVGIEDDNVYEADEFFAVLLDTGDASPNVIVGAVSSSSCRIIDNDGKCQCCFS